MTETPSEGNFFVPIVWRRVIRQGFPAAPAEVPSQGVHVVDGHIPPALRGPAELGSAP